QVHQLGVGADFGDAAVFDEDDTVGQAGGAETADAPPAAGPKYGTKARADNGDAQAPDAACALAVRSQPQMKKPVRRPAPYCVRWLRRGCWALGPAAPSGPAARMRRTDTPWISGG